MMELPQSLHERFVQRGSILHSEIFDDIGHGKFFAVIGVSDHMIAGFFFVNSRIHPAIQKKPEQFAMQYLLRKKDYDFLKYDSFLSATEIIKLPVSRLAETIADGRTVYAGSLTEDDLTAILEACRTSDLFRPSDKRKFFY